MLKEMNGLLMTEDTDKMMNERILNEMARIVDLKLRKILDSVGMEVREECAITLHKILCVASSTLEMKNRYVIYAFGLLDSLFEKPIKEMKNHLDLVFIFASCLILAFKMGENYITNEDFSSLIDFECKPFNECEKFIIEHLNFSLYVSKEKFYKIANEVIKQEF
jgi:hypothetical protein